jgi:hypothetical protein
MTVDYIAKSLDRIADRVRLASDCYERETALSVFRQLCMKNNLNPAPEGIERNIVLANPLVLVW